MKIASLSILTVAAVASGASADFTDVVYLGKGYGESVTIVSPGYNGVLTVGQLLINLSNSTGSSGYLDGNHIMFCADVFQTINGGPNTYEVLPVASLPLSSPMGALSASGVAELYFAAAGGQYSNDGGIAAGFQLAIWEVVYDYGNLDLSTGNFQASGLSATALAYANALFASVGSGNLADILGLGNETYQDLIVEVPGPGAAAVLALAGLASRRRRR